MTSSTCPLPPPAHLNPTFPSHNIYYQRHDDDNHLYYSQQSPSSDNHPSPHSHSRNDSFKDPSYNPHPNRNSNNHHIIHLPQPQLYPLSAEPPNAAPTLSHRAPQSMTHQNQNQNQDDCHSHSHAIERNTISHPASMLEQTHAPQIQTRMEARRSHGHNNHGVLMSGHLSPRAQQVDTRVLVYADDVEIDDGDDDDDDDDDDEDGDEDDDGDDRLDVVRSTETENAFFILLRLSFLVPTLTFIAALYTLAVLLFLLVTLPLRLCTPSPFFKSPPSAQICSLLLPLLRRHQRLIAPQPRSPRRKVDITNSNNSNNNSHDGRHCARYCRRARKKDGNGGAAVSTHPYDTIDSHQQKATNTTTTTTTTTTMTATTNDTQHSHPNTQIHGNPPSPLSPPVSPSSPRHPPPNTTPPTSPLSSFPSLPCSPQLKPTPATTHSPPLLLLIHLLSPLLIPALLIAAWIAASFWVFAMILGNPDGTEGRDDGRVAVLGVRNWWWRWLCWARRRGEREREREREKRRGG
ncbi:hypothetical protein, variant 2 [Blastomyces dermatitidis ATCC 26199]|nr:hypothetical protein BDFG_00647 [Blastomyces dermatitidis ATCC 26199]EQL38282.1 hypothetical protein, variant 1 [Blastomyces dermatitidis ATCC 26199]EQL38283.1 hypothetical protein, variant 2 [Blastomyces dermatitidis ATCC 26199]